MTTTIRPMTRGDIPALAELFVGTFGGGRRVTPSMCEYFAEIYLDSPWADPELPALVGDADGRVVGFLGSMPMPVRLHRETLRARIGSAFMVEPAHGDPMVAVRLLRAMLGGPQDLALTDTANDLAITFWTKLGGSAARFSSFRWLLPIRPSSTALSVAVRETRPRAQRLAAPVTRSIDWAIRRVASSPAVPDGAELREASARDVHRFLADLDDRSTLGFGGTVDEFEWLVGMMHRKRRFGPLRLLTLHTRGSAARGALLYYPNRGKIGQLALASAAPGEHATLLAALTRYAHDAGSAAVMGKADARLGAELRARLVPYLYRNDFTMLHSRQAGLVTKLCTGDIAMTHLTGEWWTKFQGDQFD